MPPLQKGAKLKEISKSFAYSEANYRIVQNTERFLKRNSALRQAPKAQDWTGAPGPGWPLRPVAALAPVRTAGNTAVRFDEHP